MLRTRMLGLALYLAFSAAMLGWIHVRATRTQAY